MHCLQGGALGSRPGCRKSAITACASPVLVSVISCCTVTLERANEKVNASSRALIVGGAVVALMWDCRRRVCCVRGLLVCTARPSLVEPSERELTKRPGNVRAFTHVHGVDFIF